MHKFSDFADVDVNVGDKIKIDDIVDKPIQVMSYRISDSKFRKPNCDKCLTLQIKYNGEDRVVFTGSSVLMRQVEQYKDKLPFETVILKSDRFYTFS